MIGAGDHVLLASALQQLMPAMGAYVEERAKLPVAPTRDEDVLFVDFGGQILAGFRHLTDMPGVMPRLVEDRRLLSSFATIVLTNRPADRKMIRFKLYQ